jgi:integrator complex subunit 5
MMSHATVIRSAPQQDLINELHTFIKGALKLERCNPLDLTKTALRLLKNIPAARAALFEYFSNVFGEAASYYIQAIETEIKTGELPTTSETDEAVVSEIHLVLIGFVADNATAWAPIVSTWSLDLLGEISTKFAGRAHISTNLNETLQLWMNCRATKILVDINTKCLSSLMHSDTETCINALLDTSVKHSPNFDWVVAHVGSCFPNTVITRVLSCGLKDFCQIKSYEQGSNSPKLRSVVGILGHLAGSHSNDIRSAILEMFLWSISQDAQDPDATKLQKKATVPFILQLSFLSSTLFSSICNDMKHILSVEVICKLYPFVEDWCKYFGSNEILEDLLLTLILSCDNGGIQIINLLLDCITIDYNLNDPVIYVIKEKSLEILQNVIYRIDESVRNDKHIEIMTSFTHDLDKVHENLLSLKEVRSQAAAQIVIFLGHRNPSILVRSIKHLFQNSKTLEHLSLLVKILTHELINKTSWPYAEKGGYFSVVLEQILSRNVENGFVRNEGDTDLTQMWNNLLILLKWEKSNRVSLLNSQIITKAILTNLASVTSLFEDEMPYVHIISEILSYLDVPTNSNMENLPIEVILNLTQSTVNYFFICCTHEGNSYIFSCFIY